MATTTHSARPEANRICNLVPSRGTEKDWRYEHALAAGAIEAPAEALPASVDLRAAWWAIGLGLMLVGLVLGLVSTRRS